MDDELLNTIHITAQALPILQCTIVFRSSPSITNSSFIYLFLVERSRIIGDSPHFYTLELRTKHVLW